MKWIYHVRQVFIDCAAGNCYNELLRTLLQEMNDNYRNNAIKSIFFLLARNAKENGFPKWNIFFLL